MSAQDTTLQDEEIRGESSWSGSTMEEGEGDSDGTDTGGDSDGMDSGDSDGTDSGDSDGTDSDSDGSDS